MVVSMVVSTIVYKSVAVVELTTRSDFSEEGWLFFKAYLNPLSQKVGDLSARSFPAAFVLVFALRFLNVF